MTAIAVGVTFLIIVFYGLSVANSVAVKLLDNASDQYREKKKLEKEAREELPMEQAKEEPLPQPYMHREYTPEYFYKLEKVTGDIEITKVKIDEVIIFQGKEYFLQRGAFNRIVINMVQAVSEESYVPKYGTAKGRRNLSSFNIGDRYLYNVLHNTHRYHGEDSLDPNIKFVHLLPSILEKASTDVSGMESSLEDAKRVRIEMLTELIEKE